MFYNLTETHYHHSLITFLLKYGFRIYMNMGIFTVKALLFRLLKLGKYIHEIINFPKQTQFPVFHTHTRRAHSRRRNNKRFAEVVRYI